MGVRVEQNAEPIPGYRLIERLGGGGFGEVWKAEAPGGLFKAIKFVYGDLDDLSDDDNSRADQEFKALNRVKSVQHPYILNLERIEKIEGQLVIVMELAHRTLWDRFRECRQQGIVGIPREELVSYLYETAEALDLMNIQYQLQHLDIKPQNLFLVHNHIKVADFGLVKDLEGMAATVTGGVTPVYAAPETFDGWLSRHSDQYSLAIVYQELLTGTRPFPGSTMRQLVLQHLQGTPDLSALSPLDRPVIARALAKNPEDRFPTCTEFVRALRGSRLVEGENATDPLSEPPSRTEPASKHATAKVAPVESPSKGDDAGTMTQDQHGKKKAAAAPAPDYAPQVLRPRPQKGDVPNQPSSIPEFIEAICPNPNANEPATCRQRGPATPAARPDSKAELANGVLQPAVVVGLGQFGLDSLRQLRGLLSLEFGNADSVPHIRLLGIDTDQDALQAATTQGSDQSMLRNSETLLARLNRPSFYIKERAGMYDPWIPSKMLYRIPKQPNQAGARSLGRLAWIDNHRLLWKRLEMEIEAVCSDDTRHRMAQKHSLGLRNPNPRVYIVGSLLGNTCGGMFLDVAYAARHLLRKHGYQSAEVVGLFILPPQGRNQPSPAILANTHAALRELQHYSSGDAVYTAKYPSEMGKTVTITEAGPPFHSCYLLSLPRRPYGSVSEMLSGTTTLALLSQFLFRDLATPLGKILDQTHAEKAEKSPAAGTNFHTFGLYRMHWPRRTILDLGSRSLCRKLVAHWANKEAETLKDEIATLAQQQWESNGLHMEEMVTKFQEKVEKSLQRSPEQLFGSILQPVHPHLTRPVNAQGQEELPNLAPVAPALEQLQKLLGLPEELRPVNQLIEPGTIEKALETVANKISQECEHVLATVVVRLMETPKFRLAGAEEALRQFSNIVEKTLVAQETLLQELKERSVKIYRRIHKILENPSAAAAAPPKESLWKGPFRRSASTAQLGIGAEMIELLRNYPKSVLHALTLDAISKVYISIRGLLSDQLRDVGYCRNRLKELDQIFQGKDEDNEWTRPRRAKTLLPRGCKTPEEVVNQVLDTFKSRDLLDFDKRIEEIIQAHYRALLNVCLESSSVLRNLSFLMVTEGEKWIEQRLQKVSVTDMVMTLCEKNADRVLEEALDCHDQAGPDLGKQDTSNETGVILMPNDQPGLLLLKKLQGNVGKTQLVSDSRLDEIVFFRERGDLALEELEFMSGHALECYQQKLTVDPGSLHSREDVEAWQSTADTPV